MKKILFFAAIAVIAGCNNNPSSVNTSTNKNVPTQKYVVTTHKDKFNDAKSAYEDVPTVDTLLSANDTTAYLDAVKKWYDLKIDERKNFKFSAKSFTIVDKNGVDLTVKLPLNIVNGINNRVRSLPEVKKLIDDTNADSLATP
ncbi:hypothetical protein HK413_04610 [Mucilaginibacter sp. S1162]|uniref:DUF4468 domain-containing protein n=1 Tax=Mucilaginibacter humi TaxID=2732510 RepID=A0ABX1W0V4_9SPHI|nr:hypothetical protein [Mucilaginibacter humi]NNU33563.1 hypothetical protein [Mucilaginibacter humi]NNU33611.1 hypothetical protein [Mucilaginibacter humi]